MAFDRVTAEFDELHRGERALRVLLVPAHRQLQHQAQQPQRGPRAPRPDRSAAGSRTSSSPTASSRWSTRSAARSPPPSRRSPRSPAAPCPRVPTPTSRTRSSPRPRRVRFVEMEYAAPARGRWSRRCASCKAMVDRSALRISFPVEVRTAPADDITLSTASGRESAYIAVHMYQGTPYQAYFTAVERILTAHGGRPHWGKVHTRDAEYFAEVYPRFGEFTALRDRLDPDRRVRQRLPAAGPGRLSGARPPGVRAPGALPAPDGVRAVGGAGVRAGVRAGCRVAGRSDARGRLRRGGAGSVDRLAGGQRVPASGASGSSRAPDPVPVVRARLPCRVPLLRAVAGRSCRAPSPRCRRSRRSVPPPPLTAVPATASYVPSAPMATAKTDRRRAPIASSPVPGCRGTVASPNSSAGGTGAAPTGPDAPSASGRLAQLLARAPEEVLERRVRRGGDDADHAGADDGAVDAELGGEHRRRDRGERAAGHLSDAQVELLPPPALRFGILRRLLTRRHPLSCPASRRCPPLQQLRTSERSE